MTNLTLELVGIVKRENGKYFCPITLGKGQGMRTIDLELPSTWNYEADEPISVAADFRHNCYLYKNRLVQVARNNGIPETELLLRIKHLVLKQEKELARIEKEVQAFENLAQVADARRDQIPESVRLFVWQRDRGKCVKCDSNEN